MLSVSLEKPGQGMVVTAAERDVVDVAINFKSNIFNVVTPAINEADLVTAIGKGVADRLSKVGDGMANVMRQQIELAGTYADGTGGELNELHALLQGVKAQREKLNASKKILTMVHGDLNALANQEKALVNRGGQIVAAIEAGRQIMFTTEKLWESLLDEYRLIEELCGFEFTTSVMRYMRNNKAAQAAHKHTKAPVQTIQHEQPMEETTFETSGIPDEIQENSLKEEMEATQDAISQLRHETRGRDMTEEENATEDSLLDYYYGLEGKLKALKNPGKVNKTQAKKDRRRAKVQVAVE